MSANDDPNDVFCYDTDDDDYMEEEEEEDDQAISDNDTAGLLAEVDNLRPEELPYQVLKEDEIRRRMEDEIGQLSSLLCLPDSQASLLLRHFKWDAYKLQDSWFANESELRRRVGLASPDQPTNSSARAADQSDCGICFDSYSPDSLDSAGCGHQFCRDCWRQYIATSDGPGTLNLRCPEPSCKIAVTEDLIDEIADEIDRKKYQTFLLRSYVEENRKLKWCPAADCEYAVQFADAAGDPNPHVSCLCSHTFCWNCCEEGHRPVNCSTVKNWIAKNALESANEMWKKAYTKPCPKCSKPIEKNAGCMRMLCPPPCGFQFCWLCFKDWSVHGYKVCNEYKPPEDPNLPQLKAELQRYQHYYDRWAANEKSRQIAAKDFARVRGLDENIDIRFLIKAWEQIVECRRVLKWTYAYGFYVVTERKEFFEHLQGQADTCLERLHSCAEKGMKRFVKGGKVKNGGGGGGDGGDDDDGGGDYVSFRMKLLELTKLSKTYFDNLVAALENGLADCVGGGGAEGADGGGGGGGRRGGGGGLGRRVGFKDVGGRGRVVGSEGKYPLLRKL